MSENNSETINKILSTIVKEETLFSVTLELLTKCNWRCKHCYLPNHNDDGLDKQVIFNILEQLRQLGTFEIVLTGGEIFYRNDIMQIIKKARQLFFKVTLLTNVSLMNENIISELSDLGIFNISCTIFSLDETIHDSITGIPGSLKKAIDNIMIMKKYNIPLEIKTLIIKDNYYHYNSIHRFCNENGFKFSATPVISYKHDGDNFPQKLRLTNEQLEQVFLSYDEESDKNPQFLKEEDYICETIRYSLFIGANGDIYPCNTFNTPYGNVHKDTIKDIWYKSSTLNHVKNIKWKDLTECKECSIKDFCYKCPGISLLEDGDIFAKSSLACNHASIRHRLYS
jgi:radical SAM protein with 4Fe4S-binding SPASM domain